MISGCSVGHAVGSLNDLFVPVEYKQVTSV